MKRKSFMVGLVALLALAGVVGFVIYRTTRMDTGTVVYTSQVVSQEAAAYVYANGKVVAAEDRSVFAPAPGLVKAVHVTLGQEVSEGDLLAELDSETLDQQIAGARIQLSIAQENLNQTRGAGPVNFDLALKTAQSLYEDALKALENQRILFEAGAISQLELDQAARQVERAQTEKISAERNYNNYGKESAIRIQTLSLSSARLALDQLLTQKEKLKIKAPADGVVYAIQAKPGELTSGALPLFSVAATQSLKVTAKISEYDIASVALGQPVTIRGEGFEDVYSGEVSYIAQVAESVVSGQGAETVVAIEVTLQNSGTKFRPNYSASIEILTASKPEALMVPYEAVYTDRSGNRSVFLLEEGVARQRQIQLGIEGDLNVEALGGDLKAGDVLILNPTETLKDGDPVKGVEVK